MTKPNSLYVAPSLATEPSTIQQQEDLSADRIVLWQKHLAGVSPLIALPTDRSCKAGGYSQYEVEIFQIPVNTVQRLKAYSQTSDESLYTLLLAAWSALLGRYSRQEDIAITALLSDNVLSHPIDSANDIANLLILRLHLDESARFTDMLKQVQVVIQEASNLGKLSYTDVTDFLQPALSLGTRGLLQIHYGFQITASDSSYPIEHLTSVQKPEILSTHFDLAMFLVENKQSFTGTLAYDPTLFEKTTIRRVIGHFLTLLESIIADPALPINCLPILPAIEKQRLLEMWDHACSDNAQALSIHQRFEAQVARTPNAIAILYNKQQLTYKELNCRANQLAHYLQEMGVGSILGSVGPGGHRETLVGVYLERSIDMIVALLAILKAGGTYIPLDPDYPAERLAFLLSDTQVSILLTQKSLAADLSGQNVEPIFLDSAWDQISQHEQTNPLSTVQPENLAYIIYTSGSTGEPKGVMVTHRSLCNLIEDEIEIYQLKPACHLLQLVSLSFDAATSQIFMALCSGTTLCISPREAQLSTLALARLLQEQAITHAFIPSVILGDLSHTDLPELPDLRMIITGGDVCTSNMLERWTENGWRFFNEYGPTEATVCTTKAELTHWKASSLGQKPPIGRPIANVKVYILDRLQQLTPMGVPGELYIGGAGLARGYFNRPQLTNEKFIPNPFSQESGQRLYRTGDLVRYLSTTSDNGSEEIDIEFLGRIDDQVKIRGFRIELGEIEETLLQHPAVVEAVVITYEAEIKDMTDPDDGQRHLIGYVVTDSAQQVDPSEIRHFLAQKLPNYMIPAAVILLDIMPQSMNGKIDRQSLPPPLSLLSSQPSSSLQDPDSEELGHLSPQIRLERTITTIWHDVLRLNGFPGVVGRNDNFFECGGNSIMMALVHVQLQKSLVQELPILALFQYPTIKTLAQYLHRHTTEHVRQVTSGQPEESRIQKLRKRKYLRKQGRLQR